MRDVLEKRGSQPRRRRVRVSFIDFNQNKNMLLAGAVASGPFASSQSASAYSEQNDKSTISYFILV